MHAAPGAPPPPSPIKARYGTPDGASVITVIVREASAIKPTFTQARSPPHRRRSHEDESHSQERAPARACKSHQRTASAG